jgi:hypothetical protein
VGPTLQSVLQSANAALEVYPAPTSLDGAGFAAWCAMWCRAQRGEQQSTRQDGAVAGWTVWMMQQQEEDGGQDSVLRQSEWQAPVAVRDAAR